MKFYNVYKKSKTAAEECILVKRGFCWENFIFGIFWVLYKKIWDLALIYALFLAVVHTFLLFYPIFDKHIIVVAIASQFMLSFYVNTLLESKLISNGYKKADFIASETTEGALLRFFGNSKKS